jgi:hypothetical protein
VAHLGIESVLVAGRGPAACAVISACSALGVKSVAVYSEAERSARHVRLADDAVLIGPAPAAQSYLAVDRIVEAARRSGATVVLPVPPALAGNAALADAVTRAGLTWIGPSADVLERLGGDGVEPASERGFLAWVTADGLRCVTQVHRDRAAGIARVSWTPQEHMPLPAAAQRLSALGWRGLVTVGVAPDGELAEVAAGFSLRSPCSCAPRSRRGRPGGSPGGCRGAARSGPRTPPRRCGRCGASTRATGSTPGTTPSSPR